jgi:hypothetical protein
VPGDGGLMRAREPVHVDHGGDAAPAGGRPSRRLVAEVVAAKEGDPARESPRDVVPAPLAVRVVPGDVSGELLVEVTVDLRGARVARRRRTEAPRQETQLVGDEADAALPRGPRAVAPGLEGAPQARLRPPSRRLAPPSPPPAGESRAEQPQEAGPSPGRRRPAAASRPPRPAPRAVAPSRTRRSRPSRIPESVRAGGCTARSAERQSLAAGLDAPRRASPSRPWGVTA